MLISGNAQDNTFSHFDLLCMKRAFALAKRGRGKTSPNPMVGAVLAKDGHVIGEGWHRRYGQAHAEAEAVQSVLAAGLSPLGADLYCTLEPCCFRAPDKHQSPCTELIIKSGIKNVYIANLDPNSKVNGKGVTMLKEAGIKVKTGLCQDAGEELNRAFFTFHRLGRPFVHLKAAQSLDGRIAASNGDSRWISCEKARRLVHQLRGDYDAVLVGRGTALADDPELTVRLVKGRNPLRVILDSGLAIPETAKLFSLPEPGKTIIIHSHDANTDKAAKLRSLGAELISIKSASKNASTAAGSRPTIPIKKVLASLTKRGVQSVLVEGGAGVYSSFLREGLWDRLSLFIAPVILGDGMNLVSGLGLNSMERAMRFGKGSFRRVGLQALFEVNNEEAVCLQE